MLSQAEFREAFQSEVGGDVFNMIRPEEIDRWINRGQARLGLYLQLVADVSWSQGDVQIVLPNDFHHAEKWKVTMGCLPNGEFWGVGQGNGAAYVFNTAAYDDGSATLLYYAVPPAITATQDSLLTQLGDDGCLSYALYRFFKRLASSRSDYRRYATISNSNGVDISELDALSEKHLADFNDARELVQDFRQDAVTFYED
jgi:hypothetical protein